MRPFILFLIGLVFGGGLYLSGMNQPSKVQGFLDVSGHWDPSLAFVMAGAVAVGLVAFSVAHRRSRTFLGDELRLPPISKIESPAVSSLALAGASPASALAQASSTPAFSTCPRWSSSSLWQPAW
jgi:hypothetical protein